jgi:hypothetical protein
MEKIKDLISLGKFLEARKVYDSQYASGLSEAHEEVRFTILVSIFLNDKHRNWMSRSWKMLRYFWKNVFCLTKL